MRNGECPKCKSHEVYGTHKDMPGVTFEQWYVKIADSSGVKICTQNQTFLCANCGYWESYVLDREIIADIVNSTDKTDWVKVVPEGWMDDPTGRHQQRYWEGTRWTALVSDDGVTSDDPIEPPPTPPIFIAEG